MLCLFLKNITSQFCIKFLFILHAWLNGKYGPLKLHSCTEKRRETKIGCMTDSIAFAEKSEKWQTTFLTLYIFCARF